jgi:hypothetical protein
MRLRLCLSLLSLGWLLILGPPTASAETVSLAVGLDRWMYPFAFTGGTRDLAPTFGAVGEAGFDNRDGQLLIAFDTTTQVPAGLGAGNYQITSAIVRAAVGAPDGFLYDGTYDPYRTYLDIADPNATPDADAGRPVELHGVGFRNGYTNFQFGQSDGQLPGFEETTAFGPADRGTRNAYALGFSAPGVATDTSNNISDGIESNAWAIGQTQLAAGAAVPANTSFSFSVDVSNQDVQSYLQQGLNSGLLEFAITSVHEASQTGGPPTPQWITKENLQATVLGPRLEITYEVVPEPSALALLAIGLAIVAYGVSRRRQQLSMLAFIRRSL